MKRRSPGEGSVYRRSSDGLCIAAYPLPNGKKRTRSAKTKPEALRLLKLLRAEVAAGMTQPMGNPILRTYLADWLEFIAPARVRPQTVVRYRYGVRWASDTLGNVKIRDLTRGDIQTAIKALEQYAPATVRIRHSALNVALRDAMNAGLISVNPAARVPLPQIHRREFRALSAMEFHALLAVTTDPLCYCLWTLLGTTGLRSGEALGLTWQRLDLDAGTLQVAASLSRVDGSWQLHEPKSKNSRRLVYLPRSVVDLLRRQRQQQRLDRTAAALRWSNEWDLVFTTPTGAPLWRQELARFLDRDLDRAGLPRIRIHDLRHTAATIALSRGIHAKIVQEMLGHSSVSITLDLYAHTTPAMHRHVAEMFDELLMSSAA
jgi:integrase